MKYPLQTVVKALGAPSFPLFFRTKTYFSGDSKPSRYARAAGACVIVANHRVLLDGIFVPCIFFWREMCEMVAEVMFQKSPLLSWFMSSIGFVRVDRATVDTGALSDVIDTLSRGGLAAIFPEGRLHRPEEPADTLLAFHPGAIIAALRANASILPLYIGGRYAARQPLRVMIGEPIDPQELIDSSLPYPEALKAACEKLRGTVAELGDELAQRCK